MRGLAGVSPEPTGGRRAMGEGAARAAVNRPAVASATIVRAAARTDEMIVVRGASPAVEAVTAKAIEATGTGTPRRGARVRTVAVALAAPSPGIVVGAHPEALLGAGTIEDPGTTTAGLIGQMVPLAVHAAGIGGVSPMTAPPRGAVSRRFQKASRARNLTAASGSSCAL
ncbi:hypothetical protein [Luteipulveratus mongoliensis]|uniref:hypothetical protein n=1 Tax=Luteipulveratus mongoliensis TaxID=571913 RepID=UPI0015CFED2A|nr:hypothetical protein [Luteipulveratus mongoliensis]